MHEDVASLKEERAVQAWQIHDDLLEVTGQHEVRSQLTQVEAVRLFHDVISSCFGPNDVCRLEEGHHIIIKLTFP